MLNYTAPLADIRFVLNELHDYDGTVANLPGFEEATRALFAGEEQRFGHLIEPWPADLRAYLQELSAPGWSHE